jgi:hypothetical protein
MGIDSNLHVFLFFESYEAMVFRGKFPVTAAHPPMIVSIGCKGPTLSRFYSPSIANSTQFLS